MPLDETDENLDFLVRQPAEDVVRVTRAILDSINADESADFQQRMAYVEWFSDKLNAAIARRDAENNPTRH